ncbi:MAG: nickel-dependent lactate racemase [Synergistetes bacterium]|nr:nickel-dependent lactate racemase [Synergistota bacterium]
MLVSIPYGNKTIEAELLDKVIVIEAPDMPRLSNEMEAMKVAILNPIGTPRLREIARGKKRVAIVINDITRPCPTELMLDAIMEELEEAGINYANVKLIVATGNHRANTPGEIEQMIGKKWYSKLATINHSAYDESELVYVGMTAKGVPIEVNRHFVEADLRIITGLISPHQGAGFSGGRKSVVPGISSFKTIRVHHSFPIRPRKPSMGWLKGNPFHEEALEGAKLVGVDFMVNVVQNHRKEVVAVVAGDLEKAHLAGVEIARKANTVKISALADVTIVSPGGYPRDVDLHQSQKAIACAEMATKPGGIIILVAECKDGIGKFGRWLKEASSPEDVIKRFEEEGYTHDASSKDFMLARALCNHKIIVVGANIDPADLKSMFFEVEEDIQNAVAKAISEKGKDALILVFPHASELIPSILV